MSKPPFLAVLEEWATARRAAVPSVPVRPRSEMAAAWVLWLSSVPMLFAGQPLGAVIVWAATLLLFGTPWPPLLPAVRLVRAAQAEVDRRRESA